jgi:hypothetical protein
MRIDPTAPRSVVYVGAYINGSFLPTGTGFLAGIRYRDRDFFFLVTADHVLDLVSGDNVYVRINLQSGAAGEPIPITKSSKIPGIDSKLDLAILPVGPLHPLHDVERILLDRGHYNSLVSEIWRPTIGDEVATVGLYTSHHGMLKNIPVVRIGHIAMLPDEPVMSTRGYVQAYLVEVRSLMGLSGSPVFVNIPETRVVEGRLELRVGDRSAICIGMMLGYHLSASAEDQIVVPPFETVTEGTNEPSLDERNTGFGVVLPIERLFEVMESDAMRRGMDDAIKRQIDRNTP